MRDSSPHHEPPYRPAIRQVRNSAAVDGLGDIALEGIGFVVGGILHVAGGLLGGALALMLFWIAFVIIGLAAAFVWFTWPVGLLLIVGGIIAYNIADNSDDFLGYLCVLTFGLFVWFTWPVGLWLLTTVVAFVVADDLARIVRGKIHPYFGARKRFAWGLLAVVLQRLRNVIKCVAIGVCVVACMQAILNVGEWTIPADMMQTGENWVSSARDTISDQLTVKRLLVIFGVLAIASVVVPQAELVSWFRTSSAWYGRTMAVMLAITSFTFFSSGDVDKFTRGWIADVKSQASGNHRNTPAAFDEADTNWSSDSKDNGPGSSRSTVILRAEFVSAVWLGKGFDRLDEKSRIALEELFRQSREYRGVERAIFRAAAPFMVRSLAIPMFGEHQAETYGSRLAAARSRHAPRFVNSDSRGERPEPEIGRLRQGIRAATEIAQEVLAHQFPGLSDRMAEMFVDEIGKALANWLLNASSSRVADYLNSAWQWMKGEKVDIDYYWRLEWRTRDGTRVGRMDVAMLLYGFREYRLPHRWEDRSPMPRPPPKTRRSIRWRR